MTSTDDETRGKPDAPATLVEIAEASRALGFEMCCTRATGRMLRALAASKPGGRLLELGTGTGAGTAWLLSGMTPDATLVSVDNDEQLVAVARRHHGHDPRVRFHVGDGGAFLTEQLEQTFDFIFADTWPGKFTHLDEALRLLKPGGLYVIDDLSPQPSWAPDHAPMVPKLKAALAARPDLWRWELAWDTGIVVAVKKP